MSAVKAFWERIVKPLRIIGGLFVIAIAVAMIIFIYLAAKSDAADLKCVTIKFKNDSELKLKTQWFINVIDTVGWQHIPVVNRTDSIATENYVLRPVLRSYRTLLFPPDVRKEPKPYTHEKWPTKDSREWKKTWTDSTYAVQPIAVTDTIPGELLLWYEETR